MMDHRRRQAELAHSLSALSLDAVLISDPIDIRYLCGFAGTTAELVFTPTQSWLVTDPRYADAQDMVAGVKAVVTEAPVLETITDIARHQHIKHLGFDSHHTSYFRYQSLSEKLISINLVPVSGLVEALREEKEPGEIEAIRKAVVITEQALHQAILALRTGITEREIAAVFEFAASGLGSEGAPFATIVAFGAHSAIPHATTGKRQLAPGDAIKIDCGARFAGYCADMTRTFFWQSSSEQLSAAYAAVLTANTTAIAGISLGIALNKIDEAARTVIDGTEFAGLFTHGSGHGLGLEVHELPSIAKTSAEVAKNGMVFTIEPGIYISGVGGIRIEDIVAITEDGIELLTSFPREMTVITGDKEG